jgi:radical SAM-linked protein
MTGDKFRFRFRKAGDLRLLSHLDLARCLERMLRRAAIPFKSSAGFHPAPRMIFAQSMPLGVDGLREVLELETTAPLDAEDIRDRLNRQAPRGLAFTEVRVVPMKASAVPRRMVYALPLPADRVEAVARRAAELLAQEKVWVDRIKPRPRKLDIRQYLRGISLVPLPPGGEGLGWNPSPLGERGTSKDTLPQGRGELQIDIWVTGSGTARADELLALLGVTDLLDAGSVLARSELELRDETPPGQPDEPPDGPPDTAPLEYTPAPAGDDDPAEPTWGLSPNGPVVE